MTNLGGAKVPLPTEALQLFRHRTDLAVRTLERVQPDSLCNHDWLGVLSTENVSRPAVARADLKGGQLRGRAMRSVIEAHTQLGAAGWDSALRQLGNQGLSEGSAAVQEYDSATERCAGCGRWSARPCAAALPARAPCTAGGSQAEGRWWPVMPAIANDAH